MAIICFDLIPEALEISNIVNAIIGIFLGIVMMIFCDKLVEKKFNIQESNVSKNNSLLKTGIIVSIGLAIHNFPEGLAIGSGFGASIKLGLSLAIAICLHDIPEGRFQSRQQIKYIWKMIWIWKMQYEEVGYSSRKWIVKDNFTKIIIIFN